MLEVCISFIFRLFRVFCEEVFTTETPSSQRFGEFFNQELFTPRPESVLSDVEGRLRSSAGSLRPEPAEGRGAISESYFTGKPASTVLPISIDIKSSPTTSGPE
jgi:hypothetical protein